MSSRSKRRTNSQSSSSNTRNNTNVSTSGQPLRIISNVTCPLTSSNVNRFYYGEENQAPTTNEGFTSTNSSNTVVTINSKQAIAKDNQRHRKMVLDGRRNTRFNHAINNTSIDNGGSRLNTIIASTNSTTSQMGQQHQTSRPLLTFNGTGESSIVCPTNTLQDCLVYNQRHQRMFLNERLNTNSPLTAYPQQGFISLGVNVSSTYHLTPLSDISNQHFNSSSNISRAGCSSTSTMFYDYLDHGDQNVMCGIYKTLLSDFEGKKGKTNNGVTSYSLCCGTGDVQLPDIKPSPMSYVNLFLGHDSTSKYFLQNIRRYNSMFSFTSLGGKIDNSINRGNVSYTFRLGGENYHSLGSLLPMPGDKPRFSQLYIYDTENEISNRRDIFRETDSNNELLENKIINYLKEMLDSHNPLVKSYRIARDCFQQNPDLDLKLRIIGTRRGDVRTYNLPTTSEVAALIVGDIGDAVDKRDIIVTTQSGSLKRISELHPSYVPLQYPIFFLYGDEGYSIDILHRDPRGVYTIKFHKRGLPHAHICLFLHSDHKIHNPECIDNFILVEIPDKNEDPELYSLVRDHMMHGPCGVTNPKCSCMVDNSCSKNFPKKLQNETSIDSNGFPIYQRRYLGNAVVKSGVNLGNRHVVPYNKKLFKKYQAHINVEWCNQEGSIKYLFKYINKGPDRATISLVQNNAGNQDEVVDEVKAFYDCRYLSACEAAWRIFSFDVHYRFPSVTRLPFHLPGQQTVVFADDDDVEDVLNKTTIGSSRFTAWIECNKKCDIAQSLVRAPKCFEDIRTVDGEVCATYRDACYKRGLLDEDNEYIEAIEEASHTASGYYLRNLFATMLITYSLSSLDDVWEKTWEYLIDGILYKQQFEQKNKDLLLSESQLKNLSLLEIQNFLLRNNCNLRCFPTMPFPDDDSITASTNRFMNEELLYDTQVMTGEFERLYNSLTDEQRNAYNEIMEAVDEKKGVFCLCMVMEALEKPFYGRRYLFHKIESENHFKYCLKQHSIFVT
ncbi:uncharacterized protein LOC143566550, partial [Bidens hawaiensis]|uniref:uncharacterized protein LOC143566550 n=1 Tax=Bidens hawaiensis TaxID=980011 RepID=UPI00404A7D6D